MLQAETEAGAGMAVSPWLTPFPFRDLLQVCQNSRQHFSQFIHTGILVPENQERLKLKHLQIELNRGYLPVLAKCCGLTQASNTITIAAHSRATMRDKEHLTGMCTGEYFAMIHVYSSQLHGSHPSEQN